MSDIWEALFIDIAVIAILLTGWELIEEQIAGWSETTRSAVFGIVMGVSAVLAMSTAVAVMPGFSSDLRIVLIAASGFFGGLPALIVTTSMAAAYRIVIAGDGLAFGLTRILIAFALGFFAYLAVHKRSKTFKDVLVFAMCVPLVVIAGYYFAPEGARSDLIIATALPLSLLSFLASLLIAGSLLRDFRRRELQNTNRIYRAMVEELPDCLNFKDTAGRFLIANKATADLMRAGSVANLIGKTDFDFYPSDVAHRFRVDEESVFVKGHTLRIDEFAPVDGAKERWLATVKTPLRDDNGNIVGLITHNRDITELKRHAEMKDAFVSTVSHELRTPLTAIKGSLGLLVSGVAGELPAKAVRLIEMAHSNCERLVVLVNDILDMEKIESNKLDFSMRPSAAHELVAQGIAASADYMPEKNVRFEFIDNATDVLVNVDPDRFQQILANLLSNAVKFSKPGGVVTVALSQHQKNVRLSVTDEGEGMPVSFRSRVFGKFEQADSSNTRTKGGTGLGLSITRALTERMGGVISFETEEGKGTTFHVDLPLVDAAPD